VRKADNLTTILYCCHEIWEPKLPGTLWGHTRPVKGLLYLLVDIKSFVDETCFIDNFVYCGFKMEVEASVHKLHHKEEREREIICLTPTHILVEA